MRFAASCAEVIAVVLVAAVSQAAAPAITLPVLLDKLRAMPGLEAHFRDEKHIALLEAPLVTEGTLDFAPPDELARRTTSPTSTVMIISGSKLSFNDGHTGDSLSLDSNPVARLFVDSFLKILSGDSAALGKMYEMTFKAGKGEAWELHLKPKVEPMTGVISSIDLNGEGVVVQRMRIVEVGGDDTVTTFSAVNTHRQFTSAERAKIFATP